MPHLQCCLFRIDIPLLFSIGSHPIGGTASNYVNQNVHIAKRLHCFWRALKLARWGEWNIIRRKSTVNTIVNNFVCKWIQCEPNTRLYCFFLLTVFRRFHGKWRETIIKNSEIFWHRVKGDKILLAKYTQTILNGFLRDVKRFSYF